MGHVVMRVDYHEAWWVTVEEQAKEWLLGGRIELISHVRMYTTFQGYSYLYVDELITAKCLKHIPRDAFPLLAVNVPKWNEIESATENLPSWPHGNDDSFDPSGGHVDYGDRDPGSSGSRRDGSRRKRSRSINSTHSRSVRTKMLRAARQNATRTSESFKETECRKVPYAAARTRYIEEFQIINGSELDAVFEFISVGEYLDKYFTDTDWNLHATCIYRFGDIVDQRMTLDYYFIRQFSNGILYYYYKPETESETHGFSVICENAIQERENAKHRAAMAPAWTKDIIDETKAAVVPVTVQIDTKLVSDVDKENVSYGVNCSIDSPAARNSRKGESSSGGSISSGEAAKCALGEVENCREMTYQLKELSARIGLLNLNLQQKHLTVGGSENWNIPEAVQEFVHCNKCVDIPDLQSIHTSIMSRVNYSSFGDARLVDLGSTLERSLMDANMSHEQYVSQTRFD